MKLGELPPSAKLVYKILEYEGELTQRQLAEETLMPQRTVRYALERLEDANVIDSRVSLKDARQKLYCADATTGDDTDADSDATTEAEPEVSADA